MNRLLGSRALRLALAAAVSAGVVVGFALWSGANAWLDLAVLQADPAFALRMPGSDELAEVGTEQEFGIEGRTSAFAGHISGTVATSADVYAFYERELARLGWRPDTPPFSSSSVELENRLYCKTKASFRLAIKDKNRAFQPAFYRGNSYTTVFDARLIAVDPKTACPRPGIPFTTFNP